MESIMEINNTMYLFDLEHGDIAGVDEAGRGPLAGPVVAAVAKLKEYDERLEKINDSKKLTEKVREELFDLIMEKFHVGVGISTVEEIDEINILNATFLSMRRAIHQIEEKTKFEKTLVDGNHKIREYDKEQEFIIKGDSKSLSIAAASIVAKVTRDRMLIEISKEYPEYLFEKHKGYGTKAHREMILTKGPIDGIHRKSFLKKILGE
ncbi:ribonuclease HII [Candidatus Cetobacterium colombiensis]|uniref:Ribonuclease HII n=1 Tax=Candidatus Cetobacterium colombiensis TaxID=3073100 RepID=A0ABU4WCC4_9FUSO|nr:ribonuclease HII [Candidatus Cetobacterium colombiensis]MDX8336682.1 ribonuclease HII [Candidatus Cetobacterium colombiensis]